VKSVVVIEQAAPATTARVVTPQAVRRLAVTRQGLAGARFAPNAEGIMAQVRDLGCLQLDPINVVARSHLLGLWSRLGAYDSADLTRLLYTERSLFEYWAHCASIVPTEDYPIHRLMMTATGGAWFTSSRAWLAENWALRDYVLDRLRDSGPLPLSAFEDRAVSGWTSSGWTSGRNVDRMLHILWISGAVMVAGRQGIHRLWDLAERVLPPWTPQDALPEREVTRRAALRAIRALGVARPAHITQHFTRGRYSELRAVLADLVAAEDVVKVQVDGEGRAWAGDWYVAAADLPLLDALADGDAAWAPRTTLLSPFDNLICDRKRTALLFDFDYRIEIYTPKEKRRWGYYVLPILHGDRLIGRIDPTMNRAQAILTINAVHAEPGAPDDRATTRAIAKSITDLATFLGARDIAYAGPAPAAWQKALR
jgi:uncharacterized protein YcaQ